MDFVRNSLELHLFFARIMKEHSFFLEIGFTPFDSSYVQDADDFRMDFDELLRGIVSLANGIVSLEALESGEIITQYTFDAEEKSSFLTGIELATDITRAEAMLGTEDITEIDPVYVAQVERMNERALELTTGLIQFKTEILDSVLDCTMFTGGYPLLIEHIRREAELYVRTIQRLQSREEVNFDQEAYEQEVFWNQIMSEHARFIRGLLDPTEVDLFNVANNFGNEFEQLTMEARNALDAMTPLGPLTEETIKATEEIRDFKTQGTAGLLACKIRSVIIPLLADHTIREANHYLRLLNKYSR